MRKRTTTKRLKNQKVGEKRIYLTDFQKQLLNKLVDELQHAQIIIKTEKIRRGLLKMKTGKFGLTKNNGATWDQWSKEFQRLSDYPLQTIVDGDFKENYYDDNLTPQEVWDLELSYL